MEQANEVQETLGRSYNLPDDIDEDDLEAGELEYLSCNKRRRKESYGTDIDL